MFLPLFLPPFRQLRSFFLWLPPVLKTRRFLRNADLRPKKRKVIDGGAGILVVVDLSEVSPEIVVQGAMVTLAEGGVGRALEVPRFEGFDIVASLQPEEDETTMNIADDGPARLGCGETSSTGPARESSPADKRKDKMPYEQDEE